MIQPISEYEYLGTSLTKFNSNMQELNIRIDNLYSQIFGMESFVSSFAALSSDLEGFTSNIQTLSSNWKRSSDLVYNLRGYWEAPVLIAYKSTFNCVANYIEIETWLNENFPPENFSPTQVVRCDFLCKNYSTDALASTRIRTYEPTVMESLANLYNTTVNDIFNYLGYKNQLEALLAVFNYLFRKYSKTDLVLDDIEGISAITSFVTYNYNTRNFESAVLDNFSQSDLKYFDSYVRQYNNIKDRYQYYVDRNFNSIPQSAINQFEPRNIEVTTGGSFFFNIQNSRWTYHYYNGSEYCASENCNDCYDALPVNELYGEKECPQRFKYLLTECDFVEPYVSPTVESLALPVEEDSEFTILDHLFS